MFKKIQRGSQEPFAIAITFVGKRSCESRTQPPTHSLIAITLSQKEIANRLAEQLFCYHTNILAFIAITCKTYFSFRYKFIHYDHIFPIHPLADCLFFVCFDRQHLFYLVFHRFFRCLSKNMADYSKNSNNKTGGSMPSIMLPPAPEEGKGIKNDFQTSNSNRDNIKIKRNCEIFRSHLFKLS